MLLYGVDSQTSMGMESKDLDSSCDMVAIKRHKSLNRRDALAPHY